MKTFKLVKPSTLTSTQKKKVLRSLMFLKLKRSGRLKGRTCADGRPQREWHDEVDATSPTVFLESALTILAIDAK